MQVTLTVNLATIPRPALGSRALQTLLRQIKAPENKHDASRIGPQLYFPLTPKQPVLRKRSGFSMGTSKARKTSIWSSGIEDVTEHIK